jgi:hypothetical protein
VAKTIVFYLQANGNSRRMGSQSQSEGDRLPSHDNPFENARSSVFATLGSAQARAIRNLQMRNSG